MIAHERMAKLYRCRRQHGFSLAELMTTLAIAGIGLSLAVPGLQNILADNRRAAAVNTLVTSLHLARSTAITRNEPVALCPSKSGFACDDGHWQDGWLQFTDTDRDYEIDDADIVLETSNGMANLDIESAAFKRGLHYGPGGHLLVEPLREPRGEFLFCDPRGKEFTSRLVIHVSGKPGLDRRAPAASAAVCESQ
jgi:type IV fimbrial biogenesis protein FimT